jgi:stage II sporulation protein P
MNDYPTYTGSYRRSLINIQKDIKKYPNSKILFDIHRDALGSGKEKLRLTTTINGQKAAQIMFVVGTDELGLKHDSWKENLKFALKLQKAANDKYPNLCRYINIRKERFNQHVSPGCIIIEVGGTGNTLEEALVSMKYFADVISEVFKE